MLQTTEHRWPSRTRSVALTFWMVAFVLTGILGWSAWQGYQTASEAADYVSWRQEAGLIVNHLPFLPDVSRSAR
jgi:hypothetical protein